jgi:LPXTG-motif cell wall-anchored protein
MGIQELFVMLLFGIVLLCAVFWIKMVIECATKEPDTGNTKIVWIIIVVLGGIVGAGIYYFVRRPQRQWDLHELESDAGREHA